jgi:eukaryotic-like serine/threonine-protein kinase
VTSVLEQLAASLSQHYRLERELGQGGMAIVYLATDLKHDRQVAVKVLRPELSSLLGADRFLREIHVTARLQHPHILPLYDSGTAGELLYYVMPLVRGESLRERLARERQLPVEEAVAITRAVASALDYAHRQGVLHRDIKPENILLHDGQPMLADFGIALAVTTAGGDRLTHSGIFIGTPSYMSPEHASGDQIMDARSDIYALACVAYEMLSGEPPFTGPTSQAVIAAMMTTEAKPLTSRRRSVPDRVATAIHQALEPLPADRFATAATFASALSTTPQSAPLRRRPGVSRAVAVPLGVAAGVAAGFLLARMAMPASSPSVRHWNLVLPTHEPVALAGPTSAPGWQTAIAISPNGDHLAYVTPQGNSTVLAIRSLAGDSGATLPGTEGAYHPFYSPDGAWIAFFTGNLLRKVSAAGGAPITLATVDRIAGATWPTADRILVAENAGFDLHVLSGSSTAADSTVHLTTQFGTPDVLPGGQWAVGELSSGQVALLSLTDGTELAVTRRGVLPLNAVKQTDLLFGTSPHWLESGYLVYTAGDGVLTALPFDGRRRKVLGGPVPVVSGVRTEAGFGYAEFAISRDGTLVYVGGGSQLYVNVAFVTPTGRIDTLPFPRAAYNQPRISPDATRLAAQVRSPEGGWQILLMDLTTGVRQPIDVQGNYRAFPAAWLPSGRELMIGLWDPVQYASYGVRIQSLETGKWSDLHVPGASYMSAAPDGHSFVFSDWRTGDLYLRALSADTTRTRIPARGIAASFSPDARWLAWGGTNGVVSVSPLPPTGAVYAVAEHGEMPVWTPKGDALIYRDGSSYYRVPISTVGTFHAGRSQLLVEGPFLSTFAWNHAMSPDGRLLVLLNSPERQAHTLGVITAFPSMVDHLARPK